MSYEERPRTDHSEAIRAKRAIINLLAQGRGERFAQREPDASLAVLAT